MIVWKVGKDGRRRTGDRRRETEDRKRETEGKEQKVEDEGRKIEKGSPQSAVSITVNATLANGKEKILYPNGETKTVEGI